MNPSRKIPRRLAMTVLACAAVLILGAASAVGQSGSSREASSPEGGGPSGAGASGIIASGTATNASHLSPVAGTAQAVVSSPIAPTAWCCATGSVPGLTVMGQAQIRDQGQAARDRAIAEAVADATDQAKAAADAAGLQLGAVLDLEVSAMPIVYPMEGIASAGTGIAAGSAVGSTGAGSAPGSTGPGVPPDQYLGSVTVTITWAIA